MSSRWDRSGSEPVATAQSISWSSAPDAVAARNARRKQLGLGWDVRQEDLPEHLFRSHTLNSSMTLGAELPGVGIQNHALSVTSNPQISRTIGRQHKRVYVGGLPYDFHESDLRDMVESTIRKHHLFGSDNGPYITTVSMHLDKYFAFVEFRTPEEATVALLLDGLWLAGAKLRFRRPKDFSPLPSLRDVPPSFRIPGVVPTDVEDTINKVFIGNFPADFPEVALEEMMASMGDLKTFSVVRDPVTNASKGYGFAEYIDPAVTDGACAALHGTDVSGRKLVVQRATVGAKPKGLEDGHYSSTAGGSAASGQPGVLPASVEGPVRPEDITIDTILNTQISLPAVIAPSLTFVQPSAVVALYNILTARDICADGALPKIEGELMTGLAQFSSVNRVFVPKAEAMQIMEGDDEARKSTHMIPAYAEFASLEDARKAAVGVMGRTFMGHLIIVMYVPLREMEAAVDQDAQV